MISIKCRKEWHASKTETLKMRLHLNILDSTVSQHMLDKITTEIYSKIEEAE
jgi:hypothetical protein